MNRDFATDPEIAAELDRQARDRRASQRAQQEAAAAASPTPVVDGRRIVERWPCRGGCGDLVDMTADAIDYVRNANRALRARGEQPLSKREAVCCSVCRATELVARREADRKRFDGIAALLRELRFGAAPWRTEQILAELRGLGHDTRGLLERIADQRAQQAGAPKGARRTSL